MILVILIFIVLIGVAIADSFALFVFYIFKEESRIIEEERSNLTDDALNVLDEMYLQQLEHSKYLMDDYK